MTCVLGRERVLEEAVGDARRRAVEHRDGRIIGVAAFEQLYGPAAEVAVSLEDPADVSLAARLVRRIADVIRAAGLQTMRLGVTPRQEQMTLAVLGMEPVDGEVTVRLATSGHSVPTTEAEQQPVPLAPALLDTTMDA